MRRALLLVPPTGLYVREDRCQSSVGDFAVNFPRPPMDLLTGAAYLEGAGLRVTVRDYPVEGGGWQGYAADLEELAPDLVLISATASTLERDLRACSMAKAAKAGTLTCVKGVHVEDRRPLELCPDLDLVIRHEDLHPLGALGAGKSPGAVCGITYREEGRFLRAPDCDRIEDLDTTPLPALHLIANGLYRRPDTGQPCAHVETCRGCTGRCIFCLTGPIHGRRVRAKSPGRVVDEVERCVRDFGIRDFHFKADTFTWNKAWVLEICSLLRRRSLDVAWFCNSRVDTIDDEVAQAMKGAGCFAISFGVESGSQDILDRIGKGTDLSQCRRAITLCRRHGILSYAYFMIGFPWDTRQTVRATIDFACDLDPDFVDFFIPYPFPGTELARIAGEEGLVTHETATRAYAAPALRTRTLTADQLARYRRVALRRFYLRPRYILDRLWQARHPMVLLNYARHGLRLLRTMF